MLIIAIALILGIFLISVMFNIFVSRRNMAEKSFATVDVMLKKRFDLIPNLVETVKAYAGHEKETLERLIQIRALAQRPEVSDREKMLLGSESVPAISRIIMLSESYPDLKANENFINLQRSLNEIEEQISAARRAYNSAITDYNNYCEMFPFSLFAKVFGFKIKPLFSAAQPERESSVVKF